MCMIFCLFFISRVGRSLFRFFVILIWVVHEVVVLDKALWNRAFVFLRVIEYRCWTVVPNLWLVFDLGLFGNLFNFFLLTFVSCFSRLCWQRLFLLGSKLCLFGILLLLLYFPGTFLALLSWVLLFRSLLVSLLHSRHVVLDVGWLDGFQV